MCHRDTLGPYLWSVVNQPTTRERELVAINVSLDLIKKDHTSVFVCLFHLLQIQPKWKKKKKSLFLLSFIFSHTNQLEVAQNFLGRKSITINIMFAFILVKVTLFFAHFFKSICTCNYVPYHFLCDIQFLVNSSALWHEMNERLTGR